MEYLIGIKSMHRVGKVVSCLFLNACIALSAIPAKADMTILVEGYDPVTIDFPALTQNGSYVGEHLSGDGAWKISWNLAIDPTATANAIINGKTDFYNFTGQPISVDLVAEVPIVDNLVGAAKMSILVATLVTDAGGGSLLSNASGEPLWSMLIDNAKVSSAFYAPFLMTTTGSGSLSTNLTIGAPIGSLAAPNVSSSIGFEAHYKVTAGDRVTLTNLIAVTGTVVADEIPSTPTPTPTPGEGEGSGEEGGEIINPEGGNGQPIQTPTPTPTPESGGGEEVVIAPPNVPESPVVGVPEDGDGGISDPEPVFEISFAGKNKKSPKLFNDRGTLVISSSGLSSAMPVTVRAQMGKLECNLTTLSINGTYLRSMKLNRKSVLAIWAGKVKLALLDPNGDELVTTEAKAQKTRSKKPLSKKEKAKKPSCSMISLK